MYLNFNYETTILIRKEEEELNDVIEKYKALVTYIKSYDFENLPTLKFPKEDAEFLRIACEKQISKTPANIRNVTFVGSVRISFQRGECPYCKVYVDTDDAPNYCTECGQKLEWC